MDVLEKSMFLQLLTLINGKPSVTHIQLSFKNKYYKVECKI